MRFLIRTVLAALVLMLVAQAAPLAAQASQDTMSLPSELRTARASLTAAFARLDGAAAGAMFADSGSVDFQGQVITGKPGVTGWFQQMFGSLSGLLTTGTTLDVKDGEVRERSSYTVTMPDGSQSNGSTDMVWKKQPDGSWKVSRLIVM